VPGGAPGRARGVQDGGVTERGCHGYAEQVAQPAHVAVGGEGFVQDAVLPDLLDGHPDGLQDVVVADGPGAHRGVGVDEQVRVAGGGPSGGAVVQPGRQAPARRAGEQHGAAADAQPGAVEVGELQVADVLGAQPVVGDQGGHRGPHRVSRAQGGAQRGELAQRQRLADVGSAGADAGHRIGEDHRASCQDREQRPQSLAAGGPGGAAGRERGDHLGAGDLPQRLVPAGSPGAERRHGP
jgi:hypothetical protein